MEITDMFGIPLEIDDYVLYNGGYNSSKNAIGKIKVCNAHDITIIGSSSYNYLVISKDALININDKMHLLSNSNDTIEQLNANDLKINERQLESQQQKDKLKAKKNELKRTMKPGDCFQQGGYYSYFMYLGVEDKKHIFAGFGKNYGFGRRQGTAEYEFTTQGGKFYQAMKSKKTATEKFTVELDVEQMLKDLENEIRNRSRYVSTTQDQIDKVRVLYNKIEA